MSYFKKGIVGLVTSFVALVGVGMVFADTGDLKIAAQVPPSVVGSSGSLLTVPFQVVNNGDPATATSSTISGIIVTITYPAELSPDIGGTPWIDDPANHTLTNTINFALGSNPYQCARCLRFKIKDNYTYRSVAIRFSVTPRLSTDIDPDFTNNNAIVSIPIGYDGSLSKSVISTAIPGSQYANRGDTVTYELSYYNSGTMPLAVNFTDNLPQGLTGIQAYSPLGSCTTQLSSLIPGGGISINSSNTLFAQNCGINPGTTGTIVVVGTFANPIYTNSMISNTVSAQVFTVGGISLISPNNATALLYGYPIISSFSKQFTGSLPQQLNDDVYYTMTITNTGSVDAQGIVFTDTPPLGLNYIGASPVLPAPTTNPLNTNLSWTLSIPAYTTQTYTLHFKLNNTALVNAGGVFVNTGSLASGSTALSGTVFTTLLQVVAPATVAGTPYLTLTKSIIAPNASGHVYQSGDAVTYQITIQNTGNRSALTTLKDTLPSQLSSISSSLAPSTTGNSIWTWTGLLVRAGQTRILTITGVLNANYPAGTVFVNNADLNVTNLTNSTVIDNGTATGMVLGRPDLVLTKTINSVSPQASGDLVSYTLTLTNTGTAPFSGTWTITDNRPTQLTTPNVLTWNGTGDSFSVTLTGLLKSGVSFGSLITNTGRVDTVQTQLSTGNDTATALLAVGGIGKLDLSKSILSINGATPSEFINGLSGTLIRYLIHYANTGSQTISGLVLSDVLPAGLVYVSGSLTPTINGSTLTRPSLNVGTGQSGTLIFDTRLSSTLLSGSLQNCVSATATSRFLSGVMDSLCASVGINTVSDITITKTLLTPLQGISGSSVSYMLTVTNNGSETATGVVVQDILTGGIVFVSSQSTIQGPGPKPFLSFGPSSTNANLLESQWFNLPPGGSGTITFTGYLNQQPITGFTYANTATVSSASFDINTGNNTSTATGFASVSIGCALTKTPQTSPWVLAPGGIDLSGRVVGYTLTLTNNGTVPLSGISIIDTRPSQELSAPSSANVLIDSLSVGQSTGIILTGKLLDRDVSSLLNSATASFVVNGSSFSCTASSDIARVTPSCNNGYLEGAEQCDTYNGVTYVLRAGTIVDFSTNTFSFDAGATTQICNANCKLQTVALNNCASMIVPGATPSTLTGCVALTGMVDPLLTLTKTVTPSSNLSSGSVLRYTITVSNASTGDAYNVQLGDVFPRSQLEYIGNMTTSAGVVSVSVNTGNQTFSGNLGAISVGSTRTISFDAKIKISNGTITNTAIVNYTNAASVAMSQLTAPVSVTLGSNPNTCGNGIKDSSESCDLAGYNRIVNYLDTTTNYPASYSEKNKFCTSSCQIENIPMNRCGDGQLGQLEMCDMQIPINGSPVSITNYLNNSGTPVSAGVYTNAGYSCTSSCELVKSGAKAQIPGCRATDNVISVMKDEVLPIIWDVEIKPTETVATKASCSAATVGYLIKDTLRCTIKLYNRNEEPENQVTLLKHVPCNTQEFNFTKDDHSMLPVLTNAVNPYGTFLVDLTASLINGGYGEYKISLDKVDYEYCTGPGTATMGNPYGRVCQFDVAVTRPYLMQKSNTVFRPSDPLDDFYTLDDKKLIQSTQFDTASKQTKLNSLEYKGKIQTLTEELLKKYDKLAVKVSPSSLFPSGTVVKKVPGKSIYILEGEKNSSITFNPGKNLTTASTLIIKQGNLIIEGSIDSNVLVLVPKGSVKFEIGSDDLSCTKPQTIRGIVIANSFEASKKDIRNTRLNKIPNKDRIKPWCARGNLHIYGALYGDNIKAVVNSRRSELEKRFTYGDSFSLAGAPSESQLNAYRRNLIYKGASVYIEQNPDLWRAMPPGADIFLKTLNVSRN